MGRLRKPRAETPAASSPPVASCAVEYRFAVEHSHAGLAYRVGDIIACDEAVADRIRRFAGEDALVQVHESK